MGTSNGEASPEGRRLAAGPWDENTNQGVALTPSSSAAWFLPGAAPGSHHPVELLHSRKEAGSGAPSPAPPPLGVQRVESPDHSLHTRQRTDQEGQAETTGATTHLERVPPLPLPQAPEEVFRGSGLEVGGLCSPP